MAKIHIGKNGPAPCKAKIKCRLGGESGQENHFDTLEEAEAAYQEKLQEDGLTVLPQSAEKKQTVKQFYNKMMDDFSDSYLPEENDNYSKTYNYVLEGIHRHLHGLSLSSTKNSWNQIDESLAALDFDISQTQDSYYSLDENDPEREELQATLDASFKARSLYINNLGRENILEKDYYSEAANTIKSLSFNAPTNDEERGSKEVYDLASQK